MLSTWTTLRQRVCASPYAWMECHSAAFETYLAEEMPSLQQCELQLPRHMRIFTFGSSYMRQLAVQLICADDPGSTNTFDAIRPDPHALTWTVVMSNNVTLTNVANDPELQEGRDGQRRLATYLERERYDVAFYMNPHPACHFDYQRAKKRGWANYSRYACVDLSTMQNKKESDACVRGTASDDDASLPKCLQPHDEGFAPSRFLATVRQHVPHVYEVAPWVPDGPSPQQRLAASNHSDRTSLVLPWAVWAHPCQVNNPADRRQQTAPDCRPLAQGHQCAPGAVSLLAAALAGRAWRHSHLPSHRCAKTADMGRT